MADEWHDLPDLDDIDLPTEFGVGLDPDRDTLREDEPDDEDGEL